MRRRAFLAALLTSAAPLHRAFAASSPVPKPVRATLTAAARALFPHAVLPDSIYDAIVARALSDPVQTARLTSTARLLDGPPATLRDRLHANFAAPGVQTLRLATLLGIYADPKVTGRFGYQGPSLDAGGYLDRGFADLPWLPAPGPAFLP